jgi:hypothetical protein
MTITLVGTRRPAPASPACAAAREDAASALPDEALELAWQVARERRFAALGAAFARQGGCLSADQLCGLMRAHWDQPLSRLARWIAGREVISIACRSEIRIPLFQFERPSLDLVPAVRDVLRTLRPVYDDWELAEWFTRAHDLLSGLSPATQLARDPRSVKEAARMDRFINRW